MYDLKRSKIIYSRDVLFYESECGFEKEPSVQERKYVEIDFPNDVEPEPMPVTNKVAESTPRRSMRERCPPNYYSESVAIASNFSKEPLNVKDVFSSPEKAQWLDAMEKEMESLKANDVWDLVELLSDRAVVGNKWMFTLKTDALWKCGTTQGSTCRTRILTEIWT